MNAVDALRAGEAVILPTDTVYGLCALPGHEELLYEIKGRDRSKPIALIAADIASLAGLVDTTRMVPGPYTFVFGAIGVRVPNLPPAAAEVLVQTGPVYGTSANLSGGPDPKRVDEIPDAILSRVGAIVDAGELPGTPSTVVDLSGPDARVLRQGLGPWPPG